MEYNTGREHLIIPEYGRHVQKMIAHATQIKDKAERQKMRKCYHCFYGTKESTPKGY